ncbi:MAG: protein kinase [Myxococcota bacterium]
MELAALRERVQPALVQDFDAVRDEFVEETGSHDLRAFVRHLRDWGLIPNDLADRLIEELTGDRAPRSETATPAPAPAAARAAPSAAPERPSPTPDGPSREIRVRVQRSGTPAPAPAVEVSEDLPAVDEIEEVASWRTRSVARAEEHDMGLYDAEFGETEGLSAGLTDDRTEEPPTESDRHVVIGIDPVPPPPMEAPNPDEDPDEDVTTLMQWDDDGEVDPDTATKHFGSGERAATFFDEEDEPTGTAETELRDLVEIDLGEPPTAPPGGSVIRAADLVGPPTGNEDETVIRDRDGPSLISFPPPPGALQGLSPMPEPRDDDDDDFDPEAETVHVRHRTGITSATPPPWRGAPSRLPVAHPPRPPPRRRAPCATPASLVGEFASDEPGAADDDRVEAGVGPAGARRAAACTRRAAADPAPAEARVGPAKSQRYRLGALVADDNVAETYEATDTMLLRAVAVRTLKPEHAGNPVTLKHFATEVRVSSQLAHPTVAPVLDVLDPRTYVHGPVEGPTLAGVLVEAREALGSRRPLPPHATRDVLLQRLIRVCEGAAHAHERAVLHRDLRPDSIVIGPHGAVWILNWGLARALPPTDGVEPVLFGDEGEEEDPAASSAPPGTAPPSRPTGTTAGSTLGATSTRWGS